MRPNSLCHITAVSVEQAAALQIRDQPGDRLVHFLARACVWLATMLAWASQVSSMLTYAPLIN